MLVVRRAEALRDEAEAQVLAALPGLGAGGGLILVGGVVDQRRKLIAACVQAGAAVALSKPKEWDQEPWTGEWAVRLAREQGHEIAPAAVDELVDRTGADLGVVANEIEKLSLHAGPGTRLELAHVRTVVGATRGYKAAEMADRLKAGDATGAVRALRELLEQGEHPVALLAFLAGGLRRSLHIAELEEQGRSAAQVADELGMSTFLLGKMRSQASAAQLMRALETLARVDLELKSGRPEAAVLQAALLEIAGRQSPRRR